MNKFKVHLADGQVRRDLADFLAEHNMPEPNRVLRNGKYAYFDLSNQSMSIGVDKENFFSSPYVEVFAPYFAPPVYETVAVTPESIVVNSEEVILTSATGGEKGTKPIQFDQIPVAALEELGRVYAYGAQKYDKHNFRKGYSWSLSFNAIMRHLWAFWRGEDNDPESGFSHLAHAAWHCFTLLSFVREHPNYDDRYDNQK